MFSGALSRGAYRAVAYLRLQTLSTRYKTVFSSLLQMNQDAVPRAFHLYQPFWRPATIEDMSSHPLPRQLTFEEVEARVMKAIRAWDRFPEDKKGSFSLDTDFANDMGFDSLDHVEIIMSLEDEFGFEIPDTDAEKLKTPRDMFKYVCEHEDVYE